jgi:hypothetical protein
MLGPPDDVAAIGLDLDTRRNHIERTSHSQHVPVDQVLTKALRLMSSGFGKPVAVLKEPFVAAAAGIDVDHGNAGYDASGNAD